jgi:hypothetical protein
MSNIRKEGALVSAWVSKDFARQLKIAAAMRDISRSELVRRALKKYMKEIEA